MGAVKKTEGGGPPIKADIKGRLGKLAESLPDAAPPDAARPSTVIPFEGHAPRKDYKETAARNREKFKPVPVLRTLADIPREFYTWLWFGRIPEDRLSLVMGEPEAGKSTLWTYLAAVVTSGGRWPDGGRYKKPGSVLVIQGEEMASKEIRDRVEKFGGDVNKVHFMDGVTIDGGEMITVSLAHHVAAIEASLDRYGDVRLVVVDPLGEFIEGISGYNETEVRKLLRPLRRMSEERGVAVLLMAHMNKDDEADITKRLMGSVAFLGICRMNWFLSVDPFDPTRRCLSYFKGNAEEKIVTGLAYGLDDRGRPKWCKEPVRMHARQVDMALRDLRRRDGNFLKSNGPPSTKTQAAMEFVLAAIAAGPKLQTEVLKEGYAAGCKEGCLIEALRRLRGGNKDEDEDLDVFLVRKKVDPAGKSSKRFWLYPIAMETPEAPAAEAVCEPDPLAVWLDDGGRPECSGG